MNWRWLFINFIPPEFNLTRAQRRHVRSCTLQLPRAGLIFFSCLLFSFVPGIALFYAILLLIAHSSLPPLFILLASAVQIAAYFFWIGLMAAFYRPLVLRALELYLSDLCGKCGYDMTGLDETILSCPECGQARRIVPPDAQCSICNSCSCDLTGLPDEIRLCPECGDEIWRGTSA